MKRFSIFVVTVLLCVNILNAQLIDNKGNRNQTYPDVFQVNPTVMDMINQVDTVNLYNTIYWMQQYVRDAMQPEALIVQNYLLDRFDEIGLETYIHNHTATIGETDTLDAGNVIAVQPGTEFPDEYIIISSHYDHPDGPGADDNASGTAGVLECARILSQYQFKRTILYIPFNGEERWMVGSYPFAQKCAREEMHITGVFNMDMIGFWPGKEYGPVTMYSGYSYISEKLYDYYQKVANLYIPEMPTLRYTKWLDSYGGDHMSFNIHEYPALYIGDIEYYAQNIYYHTPNDTIGTGVNCFALSQGFVKAVVAAAAELANGWLAPQDFSATIKNGDVFLSWNDAAETESYKVFKDNVLIAETAENSFVDENSVDGEWHNYFVKGVNTDGLESPASNVDSVFSREPLQTPVLYDFEDGTAGDLHLYNENWIVGWFKQRKCLKAETYTQDNILQIIELPWFSIPETTEDVSLGFKMYRVTGGIWQYNVNVFVEVTTDRKTWHKIAKIDDAMGKWNDYAYSLNDYIGNDYVQVRIRWEGSGRGAASSSSNKMAVDDLYINFDHQDVNENYVGEKFNLSISPNPSNGIVNVSTELNRNYNLVVYNLSGVKVLEHKGFSNEILDLSSFPKGIYFVAVDNGVDRMAKRIVIK